MKRSLCFVIALWLLPAAVHGATARTTSAGAEPKAAAAKARVPEASARAAAIARVPHGRVRSHELEKEHGKLVYSYDIEVPGKPGIDEVNVDAMTGRVVSVEHESAKTERREAAGEKKETKKTPGH